LLDTTEVVVASAVTVCEKAVGEELLAKFPAPKYVAVIASVPPGKVVSVIVAVPLASDLVPRLVVPLKKVMEPVGVPPMPVELLTVAVNVNDCPYVGLLGLLEAGITVEVLVAIFAMVWDRADGDELPAKLPAPR
jgi:hypothetical protein